MTMNELKFEIYLDQDTFHDQGTGLDPSIFPQRFVPCKRADSGDHYVALKWFQRAVRSGRGLGPPRALLSGFIPAALALGRILAGDIILRLDQDTIGFTKLMNSENYPGLQWTKVVSFTESESEFLMQAGPDQMLSVRFGGEARQEERENKSDQ